MPYEILYTSAPAGLKPGSSGYCTVKGSRGIPGPTLDLLESLSGYRHVFTPGTPEAAHNPVNWGHYLLRISGRMEHVLSRVSDCETDYTGRSNKLAHHMVVDSTACPAGPAWLLSQRGWMTDRWDGQVQQLGAVRTPPSDHRPPGKCVAWERMTGDAGWAGVIAEAFLADPERKVFVIYRPDMNILPLFEEALSLLPESRRWEVTFATHGAALPSTVDCLWSGIVSGSPEVQQSRRFVNALRINLTLPIPSADGGELVDLARTGRLVKRNPSAPAVVAPLPRNADPTVHSRYVACPSAAIPLSDGELPPSLPSRGSRPNRSAARWVWVTLSGVILIAAVTVAAIAVLRGARTVGSRPEIAQREQGGSSVSPMDSDVGDSSDMTERTAQSTGDTSTRDGAATSEESLRSGSPAPDPEPSALSTTLPMLSQSAPPATPPAPGPSLPPSTAITSPKDGGKEMKPPDRDDRKSQPLEIASAESATPAAGAAIAAIPKIVATSQPSFKQDSKSISLILPSGARLPFESVTHTVLMLPRDRADTGTSYYNIIGQRSAQSGTQIVSIRGTPLPQLDCEWTQKKEGPLTIVLIPKANLQEERRRHCIEHGVIQFRNDFTGDTVFVHFLPIVFTDGQRPRVSTDGFVELTVPEQFRAFFRLIRPEDVVLSGLELSMQSSALKLKPDDEGWTVDISEASRGCLTSVRIKKSLKVINDRLHILCEFSPTIPQVKDRLKKGVGTLVDQLKAINKNGVGLEPHNPLDSTLKIALDETKIREAAGKLKGSNKVHLDKVAKMQNKTEADAKEIATSNGEVDAYVEALIQLRSHQDILEELDESLAIGSANVGYKVVSVRTPRGSKGSENEYPPGHTETVVEAWSYRHDR